MNNFMAGSIKGTTKYRNKANAMANIIALTLITGFIFIMIVVVI